MSFQTFIEKSAKNFGVEIPVQSAPYFQDEQQAFQIQKSSIWPLADQLLKQLEVVPIDGDYKSFAQVYSAIVWVYVASWIISSSIGNIPFQICKGKRDNPEIIDEGAAFDLFEYPNEWESGSELREDLALFLELVGNGYWEKWGSIGGLPAKLFNLEPYYMTIKEHPTLKVDYYQYDTGLPDGKKKFYRQQITHFKYANPNSIFYGQGSIMPLQSTLITELYRETYNKSFFENDARPDVILKHNPDIAKGILPLQPDLRRRVAQNWYNAFGGPRKSRLPVLLESGMDISILSEARKDMDFREMEKSLRERILGCFGVPPVLANIYEGANYKEQIRVFWRVTLPPKCTRISNTIDRDILRKYDKELWSRFNLSDISALEETVKEREERLSRMLERGGITLGQYRQLMGMRVEPNDPFKDKRVISANMIPLDDFFAAPPKEVPEAGTTGPMQTQGPGFPGEEVQGEERGTHKMQNPFEKGGKGSGYFGHSGRPGEVGGSDSDGGTNGMRDGTLKLIRCQSPSDNALQAFREGKYFASQIKLVDWSGSQLDLRKPENKALHGQFLKDLKVAAVRSSHPDSRLGLEWHHIDRSSSGYMVHVSMLRDMGYKITGSPNKQFILLQKAFLNESCECESSFIREFVE